MRKSIIPLITFLFVTCQSALASPDSLLTGKKAALKRYYAGINIGFGFKNIALGATQTIIFKNDWGVGYSFLANIYLASNKPKDFQAGRVLLFIPTEIVSPFNEIYTHALLIHKEIHASNIRRRFAIAVGPSLNYYRSQLFTPAQPEIVLFGILAATSNYKVTDERKHGYGCTIVGSMGFLPASSIGIQVSAFANINSHRSYGGVQFEMLLGKMRARSKRK